MQAQSSMSRQKERPAFVTFASVAIMLTGVVWIAGALATVSGMFNPDSIYPMLRVGMTAGFIIGPAYIVIGIGLLGLNEWARMSFLIVHGFVFVWGICRLASFINPQAPAPSLFKIAILLASVVGWAFLDYFGKQRILFS